MDGCAESGPVLEITAVETEALRVPLVRTYRGSRYHMTHRSTTLTRVETAQGLVGEAYAGDEDASLLDIDRIIHEEIAPEILGQDALAVERCWELARPSTYDILRDRRLGLVASACVDLAIWDVIGRCLEQPLWRLWGGYSNRVPVSIIGGYYGGASLEEEIEEILGMGIRAMKLKVGGASPSEDAARVERVRRLVGDEFALMVDANQAWSIRDAVDFVHLTRDQDLHWFEEPCDWSNDRAAMRDVRAMGGVAICAGQSEYSARGCGELMAMGSIDYCNFDSSWSGGPTEWRRAAAIAHTCGVQMAHHEEAHVASHLLASIPHGTFVETFHPDRDPIWYNLISNRPPIVDGAIALSDRAGLGWELDRNYVEKHRIHRARSVPSRLNETVG
jgi:L-alanine-DL-glutamate epimerase-like enolase superfamily enzyme